MVIDGLGAVLLFAFGGKVTGNIQPSLFGDVPADGGQPSPLVGAAPCPKRSRMNPVDQKVHVRMRRIVMGIDQKLVFGQAKPLDGVAGDVLHHLRCHLALLCVTRIEGDDEVVTGRLAAGVLGDDRFHASGGL